MTHQNDHDGTTVRAVAVAPGPPALLAAVGSRPNGAVCQLRRAGPGETGHENKQ